MPGGTRRGWLLWGIAGIVLLVAWIAVPKQVPLLVDAARVVAPTHLFHDGYAWLSEREVLDLQPGHGVGPVIVDVKTGVERPQGPWSACCHGMIMSTPSGF